MPLDRRTALAVLRLPPSADAAAVKRAYRGLVRDHHPDVGGNAAAFQELQEAYEALVDHRPSPRPEVRRGTPSRHHAAWTAARDGHRARGDVEDIAWDRQELGPGGTLDAVGLAIRLAATHGGTAPVLTTTATSRAPGSRLNRVAGSLSPDLTAELVVTAASDDRGRTVVVTTVTARTRRARRALDAARLDGGWIRTRGSASTTLQATSIPDADPRRTSLRVVESLQDLLDDLGWPLASWSLTGS